MKRKLMVLFLTLTLSLFAVTAAHAVVTDEPIEGEVVITSIDEEGEGAEPNEGEISGRAPAGKEIQPNERVTDGDTPLHDVPEDLANKNAEDLIRTTAVTEEPIEGEVAITSVEESAQLEEEASNNIWTYLAIGILVLGTGGFFLLRRQRA